MCCVREREELRMTPKSLSWEDGRVAIIQHREGVEGKFGNGCFVVKLVWDRLNWIIQKIKMMASGPITSWQIDGETMETARELIFLGSKITADGDCSHEIKRHLPLGRKAMTNLDSTLKSRDITLPTKVCLVKAMFFPVVMYGCESWTTKKAEHWRIDAFELWSWRRLLSLFELSTDFKPVNHKGN